MAQLERADDRRETELTLARQRLRIDDKPRLALGGEDVVCMQILVDQHLLTLGRRQLLERGDGRVDELLLERPPGLRPVVSDVARPPACLFGERPKGRLHGLPETWQEPDQHGERRIRIELAQVRPRPAALQQEGVALLVVSEQAHCSVAVPELERCGLVLALPVRPLDLQHGVAGGEDNRDVAAGERLLQLEPPLLRALLDEPREPLLPGVV